MDNSIAWAREEYIKTREKHTREILEYFGNRILILPVEFSDEEKLTALSTFLNCSPKKKSYARSHVSRRSEVSDGLQSLSEKCVKSPKKCGY